MLEMMYQRLSKVHAQLKIGSLAVFLAATPVVATADILWSGDFNDKNFLNYHPANDTTSAFFWLVPEYGRPIQYGSQKQVGNGELLSLESSHTRGSKYSAKFTIKSQANGGVEEKDCDPAVGCRFRRSQLQMTSTFLKHYNAMPYGAERWMSISYYLPADFDPSGSGFGPVLWGSKGSTQKLPGWAGILVDPDGWKITHRYYSDKMKRDGVDGWKSWWLVTNYSSSFPSSSKWPQGLVDFPDEAASKAALGNLNKGGWTDFVFHFKTDVSDYSSGFESRNKGFYDVYMRAGSGEWVHVLKIRPMANLSRERAWTTSKPERVYNRGVGQYGPGGYTSQMGLYMDKKRVWGHSKNMSIYMDNHKVGDANTTFAQMSHDGSSPGNRGAEEKLRPSPPEPEVTTSSDDSR